MCGSGLRVESLALGTKGRHHCAILYLTRKISSCAHPKTRTHRSICNHSSCKMARNHLILFSFLLHAIFSTGQPACGRGKFHNGSTCLPCPAGTYNDKRRTSSCTQCEAGTYNPFKGTQGRDACRRCPRNTSSTTVGAPSIAVCIACPLGQVSDGYRFPCRFCPPGSKTPGSADVCVQCDEGTYQQGNSCIKCPPGTTTPRGAASVTDCKSCPDRTQLRFGRRCDPCFPGTYWNPISRSCMRCAPGTFSDSERATSCKICPIGSITRSSGGRSCIQCPPEKETFASGASFCRFKGGPCPAGFHVTPLGDCVSCPVGFRLLGDRCVICPLGSVSPGGTVTACTLCGVGETVDFDSNECICEEGHFLLGSRCTKCPPGTFRNFRLRRIQVTKCDKCEGGSFSSLPGQTECTECPVGTVAERPGNAMCKPCPPGLVIGSLRQFGIPLRCVVPSTNCPPGFSRRKSRFGSSILCRVNSCPPNQFILRSRGICDSCEPGERPGGTGCRTCKNSQTSTGGNSRCVRCPKGFVRSDDDATKCNCGGRFAAGREFVNGKCRTCKLGSFNDGTDDGTGIAKCKACPAGTRASGFTRCFSCRENEFSSPGSTSCRFCPPGTASYGLGEATCFSISP